jgi:hypothetical protein
MTGSVASVVALPTASVSCAGTLIGVPGQWSFDGACACADPGPASSAKTLRAIPAQPLFIGWELKQTGEHRATFNVT